MKKLICMLLIVMSIIGCMLSNSTAGTDYQLSQFADISTAKTTVNALGTGCTLEIDRTETLGSTIIFNDTVVIKPKPGYVITGSTYDMIVNNLAPTGPFQWFNQNSTGKLLFGSRIKAAMMEWWGASAGSASDQTTFFYSAANACKHVIFGYGTYLLNIDLTQITDPAGLIVEGEGYGDGTDGTVLKGYDDSIPVIKGLYTSGTILRKLQFKNVFLSQNGSSSGTGNDLLSLKYVYESTFDHVYFVNGGGWLTQLERCVRTCFKSCEWYKGSSFRGEGGLRALDQSNALSFIACKSSGSGTSETTPGFQFEGQIASIEIDEFTTIESWGTGCVLDNTSEKITGVSIKGHFEENNTADVQVGVKDSSAAYYIAGVSISGYFPGPVADSGYCVELWGRYLYGIEVDCAYVTNRDYVVDLYGNVSYFNCKIRPRYHRYPTDTDYIPVYNGALVAGIEVDDYGQKYEAFVNFAANDATPSVRYGRFFRTANSGAATITDFDDAVNGQQITIIINDAVTTVDFTSSGLVGNNGADWSPAVNDHMTCVYSAGSGKWHCDVSDN